MVKASANYNFGFNPLTNEYKVLQFICVEPRGLRKWDFELNIFTIGTDSSWRPLQKQKVIVAFDVREETFRLVPLPQDYVQVLDDYDDYESDPDCYPRGSARVVEVGGCVGVFVDKSDRIVLWISKDYQNHVWIKQTVSLMPRDERDMRYDQEDSGSIRIISSYEDSIVPLK
ncbi:unnamed protein product [Prunus armeniaca]